MAESGKKLRQTLPTTQKPCIRIHRYPWEIEHFTHKNTWTQLTDGISYEWHGKKKKKKVSSCFEKKKKTSVNKPQKFHFKQKKKKKILYLSNSGNPKIHFLKQEFYPKQENFPSYFPL